MPPAGRLGRSRSTSRAAPDAMTIETRHRNRVTGAGRKCNDITFHFMQRAVALGSGERSLLTDYWPDWLREECGEEVLGDGVPASARRSTRKGGSARGGVPTFRPDCRPC